MGLGSAYRECKASSKVRPVNNTSLRCLSSLPSSTCIRQASATHLACAWDSTHGWGRLCRQCGRPWLPSARCAWRHAPCPSRHTRRRPATRGCQVLEAGQLGSCRQQKQGQSGKRSPARHLPPQRCCAPTCCCIMPGVPQGEACCCWCCIMSGGTMKGWKTIAAPCPLPPYASCMPTMPPPARVPLGMLPRPPYKQGRKGNRAGQTAQLRREARQQGSQGRRCSPSVNRLLPPSRPPPLAQRQLSPCRAEARVQG